MSAGPMEKLRVEINADGKVFQLFKCSTRLNRFKRYTPFKPFHETP